MRKMRLVGVMDEGDEMWEGRDEISGSDGRGR